MYVCGSFPVARRINWPHTHGEGYVNQQIDRFQTWPLIFLVRPIVSSQPKADQKFLSDQQKVSIDHL